MNSIEFIFFIDLGHIQSRVVYFLMNIHVLPRTIYLTRVKFSFNLNKQSKQINFSFFSMENLKWIYNNELAAILHFQSTEKQFVFRF